MRARMALLHCGIKPELREVKLSDMPQALLTLSPKATVPVLQLSEGRVIDESLDIMRWALSIADPSHWLENSHVSDQLIEQSDNYFKPLLDKYKYADRHPELSELKHRQNAETFLNLLEKRLHLHLYLVDDQIRFADIAIFPFIRQFVGVEPNWFIQSDYNLVKRWLNTLIESNEFKTIMHKYSVWQEYDSALYLGR
ncbi:MAG: glutathione S-transferase [Candidatus Azotimanducaceae bacterium]|jgi:glutathione S-transferase